MYPVGCPSFQKVNLKIFRVVQGKLRLIDSQFFSNRDTAWIQKDLPKGEYQIQVKKYSTGDNSFDFTTNIYAEKVI